MRKVVCIFSLIIILCFCGCVQSPSEQFEVGFQTLSKEPVYATALLTEGENQYSSEILYVNGEDFLHILNGPQDTWQLTSLYVRKDYYSAAFWANDPENSHYLSYQTTTSLPEMPVVWMKQSWEDIKHTVVSTEEQGGIWKITCSDGNLTTVYQLKNGKIISIAYTSTETFNNTDNDPVDHVFTNTYIFHQISQQEVDAVFSEYLAKVQK